ncbi:DNA repair protein RecN [Hwanghaeella grinnelliae]|uniref:DNA repair protein RecN n=1 Tax=Hwanghaeella grinnelliae TaxID=2500179 RepID=A0A437QJE1_9PROT|nr:DNA repair protein RecN [Hwanghaeella grinnelliae]RVU34623.1 DNA repair protein RecN [Hwanghaeella grinnelliae]
MLTDLSIRDVVLIERLDLSFSAGLAVLTGETGAGKSILLDALGLAIGARAESRLVRHGSQQAVVTAVFEPRDPGAFASMFEEHGIEPADQIILRRTLGADGRSRAYLNDEPISVGLMRLVGTALVEIQGQFDQQGLMDAATHREVLDAYAGLGSGEPGCAVEYAAWREAEKAVVTAREKAKKSRENEAFLRFSLEELETLGPEKGEEDALSDERALLRNAEQIVAATNTADDLLNGSEGADLQLRQAARTLEAVAEQVGGDLADALAAIDRAAIELQEASGALARAVAGIDASEGRLETVEERLFTLRETARKHGGDPDDLPEVITALKDQLAMIDGGEERLAELEKAAEAKKQKFIDTAKALSAKRRKAAGKLDGGVNGELPPLKLEKATFQTEIADLPETEWGPHGLDRIQFLVATNPGAPPGPIGKIASGGELSRFLLALKVTLAERGGAPTMIFDEVDSGVGGATAAAVGERLGQLAQSRQVLVVTHSPQVAALGRSHWRVAKGESAGAMITAVDALDDADRLEEIARMLSGANVTEEARAAARRLLQGSDAA